MTEDEEIPNVNSIVSFFHCELCLEELPDGVSPREYAEHEVGWTEIGIQVWCKRHECNVIHMDFEGNKFNANDTRKKSIRETIKLVK